MYPGVAVSAKVSGIVILEATVDEAGMVTDVRVLRSIPRHLAVLAGKSIRRWHEGTLGPFVFGRLRMIAEVGATLRHRRESPLSRAWGGARGGRVTARGSAFVPHR